MVHFGKIAAALAAGVFLFHATDLSAQPSDCAVFKSDIVRKTGSLKNGREHMQRVQRVLDNARMDDPNLNRAVYEREVVRTCELAKAMNDLVSETEKQIADNRRQCPLPEIADAETEFAQDRSAARAVLADKKICK